MKAKLNKPRLSQDKRQSFTQEADYQDKPAKKSRKYEAIKHVNVPINQAFSDCLDRLYHNHGLSINKALHKAALILEEHLDK